MAYTMHEVDKMLRQVFNPKIKNTPEYIKKEIMEYSSRIKQIQENLTDSEYKEFLEFGPRPKVKRKLL
jgi:hypothetical protein